MAPTPPTKHMTDNDIPTIHTSNHISLDTGAATETTRPPTVRYMSAPAYHSPLRHHKRALSSTRQVKETLNARSQYSNSEDDGTAEHRINQYLIKEEIGRGSFGAVHLAVDQYGQEYAVKEFSKSRLRKRAQSNLLRRPSRRRPGKGVVAGGMGFNSPLHRHSTSEENNSLHLIKEEIAIMKKLNHPNLVSLIEVLDDPDEDSLYMVMEMCKKGVVMQVGVDDRAEPYDDEKCRCWFRDMILGIEYLHAQGIIHRDLKPDNCLITEDDVLKIVDFGVSEMFEKESEMLTAKSAGSPAFMPPELCVARHGAVSGKAADIWSMGVTLYCLRFGKIPFEQLGMLDLFESIRSDDPEFGDDCDGDLRDLLSRLLEKDPEKRITMEQIREHPWVTRHGTDPLLPTSENVAVVLEPPTDEEVNAAITSNMGHLVTVARAVKRFKQLLYRKHPELMASILGSASRIVQPPLSMRPQHMRKAKSADTDNRHAVEGVMASEGVHRDIQVSTDGKQLPEKQDEASHTLPSLRRFLGKKAPAPKQPNTTSPLAQPPETLEPQILHEPVPIHPNPVSTTAPIPIPNSNPPTPTRLGKGHAHNPLEDTLFLNIGMGDSSSPTSTTAPPTTSIPIVSESPSNVDMDVYGAAYQEEVERILKRKQGHRPTLYLTRRVEGIKSIRENENIFDAGRQVGAEMRAAGSEAKAGLAMLVERAREKRDCDEGEKEKVDGGESLISRGLAGLKGVVGRGGGVGDLDGEVEVEKGVAEVR